MKRIALLLLLVSGLAYAAAAQWTETQLLTRAAPTLITEGLSLSQSGGNITGIQVTVCAASTRTLSGAGSLRAYHWSVALGAWVRNPGLDESVTVTGVKCQTFPQRPVYVPFGRILYAADSVTESAGTTCDVRIDALYGK